MARPLQYEAAGVAPDPISQRFLLEAREFTGGRSDIGKKEGRSVATG
jgi:hypothetical protein